MAQPPLLCEEGNIPNSTSRQFIHTFTDRRYSSATTELIDGLLEFDLADSTLPGRWLRDQRSRRKAHVKDDGRRHCMRTRLHFVHLLGRRRLSTASARFGASFAHGETVRMD